MAAWGAFGAGAGAFVAGARAIGATMAATAADVEDATEARDARERARRATEADFERALARERRACERAIDAMDARARDCVVDVAVARRGVA